MWLACALIILVSVGFVLPCMLDITMTPDSEFTVMSKGTWLFVAGAFWIFGSVAWLVFGRPRRPSMRYRTGHYYGNRYGARDALMRHPATQAAVGYAEPGSAVAGLAPRRPRGPDDDPDFLLELERRIREARDGL
jgi:hypothetical protein